MKDIRRNILSAGLHRHQEYGRRRYTRLLNEMAVIFSVSALVFLIIFMFLDADHVAFFLAVMLLLFAIVPIINYYGFDKVSRIYFLILLYGGICFFSSILGPGSMVDIIYVSVLTVPFAITDRSSNFINYIAFILGIALFCLYHFSGIFSTFVLPESPQAIKYPVSLFIFVMPFLVLNQMRRKQSAYEEMLEMRTEQLSAVNDRMSKTNDELENTVQHLQVALNEKEVLFREVHHRVKNNMQIINSLLNLQSNHTNDKKARSVLKLSQFRVYSMAMVHQLLYNSENLAEIKCNEYIEMLVKNLTESLALISTKIECKCRVEEVALNMDTAIPLGLLINEIITNSMKHAYRGRHQGTIYVELRKKSIRKFSLEIGDDGIGFNKDNRDHESSLGMLLISDLMEQMNGTIEKLDIPGTHYRIEFESIKTPIPG